jgi:hypothetical protein
MSVLAQWVPSPDLRDAVESACRFWRVHHPNRRVPADHDHAAEFREYCRAMSQVHVGSVMDVAEAVLELSKGHWPSILEVRKCARAFALRADERANGWPERVDAVLYDDTRAVDAQCAAILRGLGLDDPAAGHVAQTRGIATVMEAVMHGMLQAIARGDMHRSRLAELRAGTYPTPAQLERDARRLSDRAAALKPRTMPTLTDSARAMLAQEAA